MEMAADKEEWKKNMFCRPHLDDDETQFEKKNVYFIIRQPEMKQIKSKYHMPISKFCLVMNNI